MTDTTMMNEQTAVAPEPLAAPTHDTAQAAPVTGLVIGTLTGFTSAMAPLVDFDGNPAQGPVVARAFAPLTQPDIGKMVALQFECGDITQAVVMGLLHRSAVKSKDSAQAPMLVSTPSPLRVIGDGDEVKLVANRKLTLQCGRASITLDVDGNVEIRGLDLLSRAAGQNAIKGSSVSIN
ncbi:DUF6484 domain-containing protein [Massilia sp. DJPM01]|uniref:DUF6484 domain-containing protein n=1 Tax=Massilia sp. DJPM01 TaxID=3024404 RepID=UPI00259D9942|nr:DUF6484 domain-containing protein [Massilia sp. DJPM01]MDM5182204.1 DUF6484 domain-containing protein [Massilia sp. DJPM01]